MWSHSRHFAIRRALLVLALTPLVHWATRASAADPKGTKGAKRNVPRPAQAGPVVAHDTTRLPHGVAEMRDAILAAVHSGEIEELRTAIELNELKPELGAPAGSDPIAHLMALSGDGRGREILAVLGKLLEGGFAVIPTGKDIENNRVFVWPYFAEVPLAGLSPVQEVELYRLVTPAEAAAMRAANKWTWWRLAIGADGTWHSFGK